MRSLETMVLNRVAPITQKKVAADLGVFFEGIVA